MYICFFNFFLNIYIRSGPVFRGKKFTGPKIGPDYFDSQKFRPDRTIIPIKTEKKPIIWFDPVSPFGSVQFIHTPRSPQIEAV